MTFLLCVAAAAQTGNQPSRSAANLIATPNGVPDIENVITGLEAAQRENHSRLVPYTVTRQYELFDNGQPEAKSTVVAEVSFRPPLTKTYTIKQSSGSSRGEKVVKNVLDREVRFAKDGKIAISRRDYDFRYVGMAADGERPCYVLELLPKRNDSDLLRGRIWVDRDTYLIHRFEGQPAKNPSWWLKDLKLSMNYGDVGGMWLQTISKGVAEVRLFGPHTMTERTLNIQAARPPLGGPVSELARLQTRSSRPYRPSPVTAVGAGIIGGR